MSDDRGRGVAERWSLTQIGAEMAELIAQLRGLPEQEEPSAAERDLAERLDQLEGFAPLLPARDAGEGLVQVLVLARLRGDVELLAEDARMARELAPLLEGMDGCLRSLAQLLARDARAPAGALPIEWYLSRG